MQVAIPEVASLQVKLTVTSLLRQPLALASGLTLPVMMGRVVSRWIVTNFEAVPPLLVAEQVKVTPVVSVVTAVDSQPVWSVMEDSLSATDQLTVTSLVYQLLLPNVPLIVGVMTGGVVSAGFVRRKSTVLTD